MGGRSRAAQKGPNDSSKREEAIEKRLEGVDMPVGPLLSIPLPSVPVAKEFRLWDPVLVLHLEPSAQNTL